MPVRREQKNLFALVFEIDSRRMLG